MNSLIQNIDIKSMMQPQALYNEVKYDRISKYLTIRDFLKI